VALLGLLTFAVAPFAAAHYGLIIGATFIAGGEWTLLGAVVGVGVLASLVPGYRAYRLSLADGLTPRI
jgi:putative ABC transport system permease protein